MPGDLSELPYGKRLLSTAYGDLRLVTRADPESWQGCVRLLRLGALQVAAEECDAVDVVRTTRDTADGRAHLFARLQLEGSAHLVQDGRRTHLHPGVLAFYDASRSFRLTLPERQRARVLMVPRPILRLAEPEIRRVTAKVVGATPGGPAALLLPLLSGLVQEILATPPAAGEELAGAVADVLATLAADQLDATEPADAGPSTMIDRVKATIETRLAEPELTPRALADEHGISLRYLHKLFQEQGATVGGWIRRRRLEVCRAELGRPTAAGLTIAAVAGRWGFISPAHFSHAFRKEYGMSPAQYRGQRQGLPSALPDQHRCTGAQSPPLSPF
ncbi:helix-turn-helix domain-containing protein [Streptomyces cylindrosporus]|uniref:Helix-turn-helix domain-containing protein n=1 Tax=Streptomyces cylindrosporus TaxID=2927583 RepID=A0ABS9Y8M7_9ACTN|nr:helix-turn-helix domain-containing protein [Streptomyces cylindrosporus]MCI3273573.1 helix-turn-helix domain-containing protein [Streptomyces cylindrosporus]